MSLSIKLGNTLVELGSKPYVIAEIGVNHEGSMSNAKRLIDLAKEGGADAAKFQSYKAETLASRHSPAYWDTTKERTLSQFELFKKHDSFGADEYKELALYCGTVGIDFVSTPFDFEAINFLDPLVPFFKIASADLTNTPFLRRVAETGKPVLLSTGASTLGEIDVALNTLEDAGSSDIALLHCVLNYPTANKNAHLQMIEGLRRAYPNRVIGYSDHTMPDFEMTSLVTAHLLGALVIEKHFTDDKTLEGNDHYHAMDVCDLKRFVKNIDKAHDLLGGIKHKRPTPSEAISRKNARRSIVLRSSLKAGQELTLKNLTCKRPGTGISPIHWDAMLGCIVNKDLDADHVLQWEDVVVISE